MKAICVSACEVDGFGIVTAGEEVELPDGYAKDERINVHFVIDQNSIKDPNATIPDFESEQKQRFERFRKSLLNETDWWKAVNKLMNDGATLPNEVVDRKDPTLTEEQRTTKLAEFWTESFGWKFPTDPEPEQKKDKKSKGQKQKGSHEKEDASCEKDKGAKGEGTAEKPEAEDLFGERK